MAFDQNQIVKDLRPLKLAPTVPDEALIVPAARNVETFVANPSGFDVGSPGSGTVFYPATVSEGGYVGLGYPNALPGVAPQWCQQVPVAVGHPGTAVGFNYAHNLGNLVVGNGKDRAGTENMGAGVVYGTNLGNRVGDCSVDQLSNDSGTGFGGSPSMRIRVGSNGADRASEESGDDSVSRKKVKFLCSFGGKILPRPSDGMLRYVGGQTRIISVRKDTSFGELVQKMEDLYGQPVVIKYQLPDEDLDALVSVSCADDLENMLDEYEKLVERSPDGSAKLRVFLFLASELDHPGAVKFEDFRDSGQKYVEAVNGVVDGVGAGGITRKESMTSATSTQNSDFSVSEAVDGSGLGQSEAGGSQSTSATPHDMSPRVVVVDPNPAVQLGISPPNHYMHTYAGPRQEMVNCAMLPPQMGFPNPQLFGAGGPIYTQQQFPDTASGVSTGQFIPTVHMTMTPSSSLVGMRPTVMQQQQTRLDRYPEQSTFGGRVVQLPVSQNYNPYQGQVGGGYMWNPHVRPPEGLVFSDGLVPRQVMIPDKVPRLEDCYMCQKALPHAHSDTVVQGQKGGVATSPLSDPNLVFHSLPTGNATRAWPMNTGMATRAMEECNIDQGAAPRSRVLGHMDQQVGFSPNLEAPYQNEKTSIPQVLAGDVQSPYGVFTDGASQQMVMPIQYPVKQEAMVSKPVKGDEPTVVVLPTQTSEDLVRESPREYPDELRKEDMILKSQQALGREGILDSAFSKPQMVMDTKPMEMPSSSHTGPTEPRGNVAVTGIGSTYAMHNNIPPGSEWMVDDASRFQRKAVLGNVETFHPNGNMPPSSGAYGDSQDFSPSLFSNQDPWNMRQDAHFVPPKPSKFLTKKETSYTPFDNNNLVSSEELLAETLLEDDRVHQPLGNSDKDSTSDCAGTTKADELIKQELKATAEGVAANVLQTSISSASEINGDSRASSSIEMHHKAILEDQDKNTKVPEKVNLSYPVSDDIGRLQIIKNSDLEELRELGSGTFGTVYHGKWRGTDVAIKRINERCFAGKASEQERMRDDFWNEAIKLADLHHPNVVAFYGIVLDGPGGSVATVTEFMVNGSLRNALQRSERNLDKRKRLLIAMDVAFGMEYLHGKNIVHFDLKSDNLLVNLRDPHRPICKVGDLGLSKVKCQTLISGGVRGTLPWMAPELLNGSSNLVSEKVDVFSFGIVLWELLTGEEPYADLHYGAIIGGIVSNTLRPPIPESCDQEWRSLMERCWAAEPAVRPNFTDVADELRSMAVKLPPRGQQQQVSSPQTQNQK